ncbi:MAG: hypothetical protein KDB84_12290 [Flavobacteriales bacterium]|nr:hypothetical protein [Flavobacteriales bacterium]
MRSVLFACLLLLFAPLAQGQPPDGANMTDAKGRKQGSWSKSWENGKLRYTGQFKDDRPTGTFRHFNEEGDLTTVQVHAGDGRTSRAEHFRPDGTLMARGRYFDQEKDSTWTYYFPDGGLNRKEHFRNGTLHGEQVTYYPGGQVAERRTYENGLLNGESKSWFANGKLKSEATYVNDEPEGRMIFYFPKGNKEIEGMMVNGLRDGTWYYFNPDGSLQLQALYAQGELVKERKENGTFKEYYDDEQLRSEVTYVKGSREGPFTEYHDNGKWQLRPVPADPVRGTPEEMERVLVGQTKLREGVYRNDLLEGEVKEYNAQGKVIKTMRYAAGEVVGEK